MRTAARYRIHAVDGAAAAGKRCLGLRSQYVVHVAVCASLTRVCLCACRLFSFRTIELTSPLTMAVMALSVVLNGVLSVLVWQRSDRSQQRGVHCRCCGRHGTSGCAPALLSPPLPLQLASDRDRQNNSLCLLRQDSCSRSVPRWRNLRRGVQEQSMVVVCLCVSVRDSDDVGQAAISSVTRYW